MRIVFLILLALFISPLSAHEVRPAYLKLQETSPAVYEVIWKVPASGDNQRLGIYVEFPEGVKTLEEPLGLFLNGYYKERMVIAEYEPQAGEPVFIKGLSRTKVEVFAEVNRLDLPVFTTRVLPSDPYLRFTTITHEGQRAEKLQRSSYEGLFVFVFGALYTISLVYLSRDRTSLAAAGFAFVLSTVFGWIMGAYGVFTLPLVPVLAFAALGLVYTGREMLLEGDDRLAKKMPWMGSLVFGFWYGALLTSQSNDESSLVMFTGIVVVLPFIVMILDRPRREKSSQGDTFLRMSMGYTTGVIGCFFLFLTLVRLISKMVGSSG